MCVCVEERIWHADNLSLCISEFCREFHQLSIFQMQYWAEYRSRQAFAQWLSFKYQIIHIHMLAKYFSFTVPNFVQLHRYSDDSVVLFRLSSQ